MDLMSNKAEGLSQNICFLSKFTFNNLSHLWTITTKSFVFCKIMIILPISILVNKSTMDFLVESTNKM